jgi:hypothetical protein
MQIASPLIGRLSGNRFHLVGVESVCASASSQHERERNKLAYFHGNPRLVAAIASDKPGHVE